MSPTTTIKNEELTAPEVLLGRLLQVRQEIVADSEHIREGWNVEISPERERFTYSVNNLAHYLALRRRDLRPVQDELRPWGLSSLGRIEAQVMPNLDAVIATVAQIANTPGNNVPARPDVVDFTRGTRRLDTETEKVLGPPPSNRRVRMMVTMPSEAADDSVYIRDLVAHGMNIARINCAHDTPKEWRRMIKHIRAAEKELGVKCRIAMDLGGPKSRTADILQPDKHRVQPGEIILLTGDTPVPDDQYPVQVRGTLLPALEQVQVGQEVWFDDGVIGALVRERRPEGIVLEVIQSSAKGEKLKEDKGINFPDTELVLHPLTDKDLEDLDFAVRNADIINYSFVQRAEDMRHLHEEIQKRKPKKQLAIIAKIETAMAVRNLPEIIVAAGSLHPIGVMIARGDLVVEIGPERMAEMQEEMLWVCEAAHVPVIWATQVLETLAKKGRPTRAEVTDAAMAERAECVMLNKGPYILDAMKLLDDILGRMAAHQTKKVSRLRALRSW